MKKIVISKLFLYRYRFHIGYVVLGLTFIILLFVLPLVAQTGLSEAEMTSVTESFYLNKESIFDGNVVNLPYKILQKYSIVFFGLSEYSVKLPSIVVGLALGLLLVLLLNRWFKSNVSILASGVVLLSTPFLYLAGSGTPLIMIVFWPTFLLWLGSKIQGEKRPKPAYSLFFALALSLSIFTPYMIYFAIFCVLFVFYQPHLRFVIRSLPKISLIATCVVVVSFMAALVLNIINHTNTIMQLLFSSDFQIGLFFSNIANGFAPLFSWRMSLESVFLSPLISMPIFALAMIGLFSTTKGFFASRNSIASIMLVFCLIIAGFDSDAIIFFILPFSILVAHGIRYMLEKWYGLFPENPYARVSALLPLIILFSIIIIPGLLQYIYGYKYNPNIATEFNYDIRIIRDSLSDEELLVYDRYEFYKILEFSTDIRVVNSLDSQSKVAILGKVQDSDAANLKKYVLNRIITSSMRDNSDIIYVYTHTDNL